MSNMFRKIFTVVIVFIFVAANVFAAKSEDEKFFNSDIEDRKIIFPDDFRDMKKSEQGFYHNHHHHHHDPSFHHHNDDDSKNSYGSENRLNPVSSTPKNADTDNSKEVNTFLL